MAQKTFGKKIVSLLILLLAILASFGIIYFQKLADGKLHLIFCDVGQGDAILIKTPKGAQVLIDGGPDDSVLSCLGEKIPFLDRTIELVILTHPQADHLTGLISVFQNYKVEKVLKTQAVNQSLEFTAFSQALKSERAQIFNGISGFFINLDKNLKASILWPSQEINLSSDLNDTSIVLRLDYSAQSGSFCALLTGDATNNVWFNLANLGRLSNCHLLKIAHHGSKNATSKELLKVVNPIIAVISSGKNNRYGHPHQEVIESLEEKEIKILATAEIGIIEIVTDGKKIEVRD